MDPIDVEFEFLVWCLKYGVDFDALLAEVDA